MCLALPGRVVEIVDPARHLVLVELDGTTKQVSTAMLDEGGETVAVGDWLEIHLGMAFTKLDEAHAQEILDLAAQLDDPFADLEPGPAQEPSGA